MPFFSLNHDTDSQAARPSVSFADKNRRQHGTANYFVFGGGGKQAAGGIAQGSGFVGRRGLSVQCEASL
jgi:hypothetical protein